MSEHARMMPTEPEPFLHQAWSKLWTTLEMIKFEHSVFALPFALTGAMLAVDGWPSWQQVFWIIVAMVGARSAAMAFNRIADRKIDARNPRTQSRALPAGHLSLRFAAGFTMAACGAAGSGRVGVESAGFQAVAHGPGPSAALLLHQALYALSHIVLGACLGLSPVAAWIALRGDVSLSVILLGVAVTLWVAGLT